MNDQLLSQTQESEAPDQEPQQQEPQGNPWERPITDYLPEEYKDDKFINQYKTLEEFVKGAKHTKSFVGKKMDGMVKLPSEESSEEEREAFYKAIGRPEKPEEYNLPEGVEGDESLVNWFREAAHKAGLNESQFQSLLEWYNNLITEHRENSLKESHQELVKVYGRKVDSAIKKANGVMGMLSPDLQTLIENKYGNDSTIVRILAEVGNVIGEDAVVDSDQQHQAELSREAVFDQIKKINEQLRERPSAKEREGLWNKKMELLRKLG